LSGSRDRRQVEGVRPFNLHTGGLLSINFSDGGAPSGEDNFRRAITSGTTRRLMSRQNLRTWEINQYGQVRSPEISSGGEYERLELKTPHYRAPTFSGGQLTDQESAASLNQ
jgi:hypothetical protein